MFNKSVFQSGYMNHLIKKEDGVTIHKHADSIKEKVDRLKESQGNTGQKYEEQKLHMYKN